MDNVVVLGPVDQGSSQPHHTEDMDADADGDSVVKLEHAHIALLQVMRAREFHPPVSVQLGALPHGLAHRGNLVADQHRFRLRCRQPRLLCELARHVLQTNEVNMTSPCHEMLAINHQLGSACMELMEAEGSYHDEVVVDVGGLHDSHEVRVTELLRPRLRCFECLLAVEVPHFATV